MSGINNNGMVEVFDCSEEKLVEKKAEKKVSKLEMYSLKKASNMKKHSLNIVVEEGMLTMLKDLEKSIDFNRFVVDSLVKNGIKTMHKELKKGQANG